MARTEKAKRLSFISIYHYILFNCIRQFLAGSPHDAYYCEPVTVPSHQSPLALRACSHHTPLVLPSSAWGKTVEEAVTITNS